MRNELIELYQLACANPNDKDIVRSYQRAKDRIGPQIAVHEAMDADNLRTRVARLEEAGRELLEACEAADIEGDLSEHVSGDMMFNFRRALEEK